MRTAPNGTSNESGAAALVARDVRLTYPNGVRALDGASISVAPGEFLAIIGPNGSGKSSFLRVLAGLQPADSGQVLLEGDAVSALEARERARRVALVPQTLDVLPGYSVEDFVLMGRYSHLSGWRLYTRHDYEVARECLKRVDAAEFSTRGMNEMSGGERQRALVARALAQEARTVLLDEPTSALDLSHQLLVYRLIHEMHRGAGRTIVVVTHDLNLASQFAQRLALMQRGRMVSEGAPADVLRREVLEKVYGSELAYGMFERTIAGGSRPWVLPWARPETSDT
ncbi:MAG: ABC transporter ATP-binding protein [Planctomycetota bacterium]|nr:ABC transporter ATP-binding protein [Planctomycetota bacterium]